MVNSMAAGPCNNTIGSVLRRMALATVVYYDWKEKNLRLFTRQQNSAQLSSELVMVVSSGVGGRLFSGDIDGACSGVGDAMWMTPPDGKCGRGWHVSVEAASGIGQNMSYWTAAMLNGESLGEPQSSNLVANDNTRNQVENGIWHDLIRMNKDLTEETLNSKNVAHDIYTTDPLSMVQNRLASAPNNNLNLNRILNSTPVLNNSSNEASPLVSYFPSEDPAIVRSNKSSASEPFIDGSQNNNAYDLNSTHVLNPSTHVGNNSVGQSHVHSMLTTEQSLLISGHNSNQFPPDGFLVPCCDLNMPPRSEHDAASAGDTEQSPFSPIPSITRQKKIDNQWTPTKDGENVDNHYNIGDLTSSAISTTQHDRLIPDERDELGIDLNRTPIIASNDTLVKRKYVRKIPLGNGVEVSPNAGSAVSGKYEQKKFVDQSDYQRKAQLESDEVAEPVVETPVKSCKNLLTFDLQEISPTDNPQDIKQDKRIYIILKRSAMGVTQNNIYGQIGGTHDLNVPPALMAKVHSHALNVLERNLSMKYSVLGQSILRIEYNNQMVQSELSGNMVNTDERRGVKRPFLEQINLHNQNAMDSLQMYQDLLLLEARDHALNVLRRNPLINISVLGQSILKNEYNRQMSRKEPSGNMVNIDEKRGVKKSSLEQINPRILNATDTLQMYQELLFEARDHALNVLARNLRMKISDFGQSILRNEYSNQMGWNEPSGHMVDIDEGRGVQRPSLEEIDPRNL
ncbi:hypothetical protein Tco_0637937, partial [Tanacetum coccineum]